MARTKKKAKKKRTPTRRGAKSSTTRKPKRKAKAASKRRSSSAKTEVERRWREYWSCRKDLEEAVDAVRAAQTSLAEAAELERTRRAVFEKTKDALKQLLEVESPTADPSRSSPPAQIVDFEGG